MTQRDAIPDLEQLTHREPLARDGSVWRAHSPDDPTQWRLQKLDPAQVSPADAEARIQRWSAINHLALLKPYGARVDGDDLWIIRPWVEAGSRPQTPDESLAAAQRLAEALAQMHERSFAHGCISPENVLFAEAGGVKLTDFSLTGDPMPRVDLRALARLLCEWLFNATSLTDHPAAVDQWLIQQAGRHDLPPQLGRLLHRLLCNPASLTALQVRDRLDDVRLVLKRSDAAARHLWDDVDSYAAKTPPPLATGAYRVREADQPGLVRSSNGLGTHWPWFALAAAVLVIGMGLLWRLMPTSADGPEIAAENTPPPPAAVQAVAPAAPPVAPPSQYDLEVMLRHRDAAQEELDALINLQLELEEQQVAQWAPQAFTAARARAREGDEPFRSQQFEQALEIYTDAHRLMKGIAGLRPLVVGEALERGRIAMEERRSEDAQSAFELALAIEPDHQQAADGLARAKVLDELIVLLNQASLAMEADDFEAASELYAQAEKLDPQSTAATNGLAQARAAITDRDFRQAMSRGLASLQAQDWGDAERALKRALAIRPGAQAANDALTELQRQRRDASVADGRALASKAVAEERWEAAVKHFDSILARDPNLKFAQHGRAIAADRLDLDQRLEQYTGAPGRWWSQEGRQEARSLLHDAEAVEKPGPRLAGQIRSLGRQIALAEEPVTITLQSDNACDVVVYKVARLGRFESHQLRLLPGRYTAVGTRDGYRDVRREFIVPAGRTPEPVVLRCEEQVLAGG